MGKKYLKILSTSLLISGMFFVGACSCKVGKVKVTFVSEGNSDIVRYVKKGKSLYDLPETPQVKAKYCVWDREEFENIQEDITVNAVCYSTVTELHTNIPDEIDVNVSTPEADLEHIFKDIELEATFESGETKKLYHGDFTIDAGNYNKDKGGSYTVSIIYNNAKKDVKIYVNKIDNYVTVSLERADGYYNEGLPGLIANTDVEGSVSFDQGQTLYVGSKSYSWTFTPANRDKYEIVKGTITVNLQKASMIVINKESIEVDFGSTKKEIIEKISEGLIVKGKYGNIYKEIDPAYYTIDSIDFVSSHRSGTFNFRVSYDSQIYAQIEVTVNKCDDYNLVVEDIEDVIIKNGTTLSDIIGIIEKESDIDGVISFVEGQILNAGSYEYDYIFTPNTLHYAPREGKIRVTAYKAQDIEFTTMEEFDYGTDESDIIRILKENIAGTIIYNNSLILPIDNTKVNITIENSYNKYEAGEYTYTISYNDEIQKTGTFIINKIVLQQNVDFIYHCGSVDPSNPEIMPICTISRQTSSKYDFDPSDFTVVQVSSQDQGNGLYKYVAELIPNDDVSNNYETVIIEVIAFANILSD